MGSQPVADATSTTFVPTRADVGQPVKLCVTALDANDTPGGQTKTVCSSPSTSVQPSASAGGVTVVGDAFVGATLTASYTFQDAAGLGESGSTYQWYTVSGSTLSAIPGATGLAYTPTDAEIDQALELCVTTADANGPGAPACSAPTKQVAGIVWYSQANWTGVATPEPVVNGACVNMGSLGLSGATQSVVLFGNAGNQTTLFLWTDSDCVGFAPYSRTSGANGSHDINLGTVGIGICTVSYKVFR